MFCRSQCSQPVCSDPTVSFSCGFLQKTSQFTLPFEQPFVPVGSYPLLDTGAVFQLNSQQELWLWGKGISLFPQNKHETGSRTYHVIEILFLQEEN